jgi:hypothetical protein
VYQNDTHCHINGIFLETMREITEKHPQTGKFLHDITAGGSGFASPLPYH